MFFRSPLDLITVLERLEEMLQHTLGDRQLLGSTRDVARLLAWLQRQPRRRLVGLTALGAATWLGAMLWAASSHPEAEPPWSSGPVDDDD